MPSQTDEKNHHKEENLEQTPLIPTGASTFQWRKAGIVASIAVLVGVITLISTLAAGKAPQQLSPASGASMTSTPTFQWGSLGSAGHYKVQIFAVGADGKIVQTPLIEVTTNGVSYTPSQTLPAGTYKWRVRAIQPITVWSPKLLFTIGGGNVGGAIQRTAGAINVRDTPYGAKGDGTSDDTQAFRKAIAAAGQASAVKYGHGPTGQAQGVVYVPAGTYRLLELTFDSNIRLEVDAAAVLEQAGGKNISDGVGLIRWDGPIGKPLTNVSLVGVGTSAGGIKTKATPVAAGRTVDNSFTFNLDPLATTSSNKSSGLIVLNTQGFLVANVFSIENDYLPSPPPTGNIKDTYPTSQKAALVIRARADSPCGGGFAQPKDGTVTNWYNVHGPKGYGPNQVGAGTNITFSHIFTQGGTALRLETDSSEPTLAEINAGNVCPGSKTKFGSEVRGLTASDIEGLDCNRAVSFTPHLQDNYDVHVTGVLSTNCSQAVIESRSPLNHTEGSFNNSTITNVRVIGSGSQPSQQLAQNGTSGAIVGYWSVGESLQAFARDNGLGWSVTYSQPFSCQGSFQTSPNTIVTSQGPLKPTCSQ